MTIKSPQTLVAEALNEVKTITPEEAMKLDSENKCNLIDIREISELEATGKIKNSLHIPRGVLEFSIHPTSPFFKKEKIDSNKEMILFCAAGGRSALAAKTLQDMGFEKVSHIDGGFSLMINSGFEID